jgi:hypothetical protein
MLILWLGIGLNPYIVGVSGISTLLSCGVKYQHGGVRFGKESNYHHTLRWTMPIGILEISTT